MPRKSGVERLDADTRREVIRRLDDGDTIDQVSTFLERELGAMAPSRSAIGRFAQRHSARRKAAAAISDAVADITEPAGDEALDLMMELAAVRIREAKIIARLTELGAI